TMDDTGGHNLLEPALFAKPALFGANYRNARNAGRALIKGKGGFLTKTANDLALKLSELLCDPAALREAGDNAAKTLSSLRGATARTSAAITAAFN
ncbi:MAG: 3-deoxy-D-manno-octulosonic acid transferase, partial [Elusimicrobiales bacterium]